MKRHLAIATAALIFGIPTIFFLFYGMFGGMTSEYSLTYISESEPGLGGFLYRGDQLRIYTNLFYHVGYLISKLAGQTGSWIGYHVIYCLLLMAKGLLVFLVCRLVDMRRELSALAAAISLIHAADPSLGYVGQLQQFGIAVWVLLSIYLFLLFLKQRGGMRYVWLLGAPVSSAMGLWSYEGTLPVLLLYPVLFVWILRQMKDPFAWAGTLLTMVPAILYLRLWVDRILSQAMNATYQARVMREDIFNVGAVFRDFKVMALRLFDVPDWMSNNVWTAGKLALDIHNPYVFLSLTIALILFLYFGIVLGVSTYRSASSESTVDVPRAPLQRIVCANCLLLIACLLPFLALKSGNPYWRTQILPGPFASILGAIGIEFSFIWVLQHIRIPIAMRCALYSTTALLILAAGFTSIATRYQDYNRQWEVMRAPFARLLQTIPSVRSGTVIMLQNVPVTAAPWGSNYWFDMLLRLCYPHTKVSGSYSFASVDPQSPGLAPILGIGGQFLSLSEGKSVLVPHGALYGIHQDKVTLFLKEYTPLIDSADISDVIVLDWTDAGPYKIVHDVSQIGIANLPCAEKYHPEAKINISGASPIALRRFASVLARPLR